MHEVELWQYKLLNVDELILVKLYSVVTPLSQCCHSADVVTSK